MKIITTLCILAMPSFALAQSTGNAPFPEMINPRGFFLPGPALLYRQLRDTAGNHFTRRLHPGNTVILAQRYASPFPRWIKVVRGNDEGTNFLKDTTTYYLHVSAIRNAQIFVLL